jgi:molybdopterin synthase sulfur carrier subunit
MNIRYFAWLRGKVGRAAEEVSPPDEIGTVGELMAWLAEESPGFAEAIAKPGVIRASVNQDYAYISHLVKTSDDVDFLPPVTGG